MSDHKNEKMLISRRNFLIGTGFLAASAMLPFNLAFAAAPTEKRLLVVILRGAMDGLSAIIPYSDAKYMDIRGAVAMPQSDDVLIMLDKDFAMHKAMQPLADMYKAKEMVILHAAATPYRDRSHFDAQDLLENGSTKPHLLGSGWLNRSVSAMNGHIRSIALGPSIPLVLKGDADVTSWSPSVLPGLDEDFLTRVMHMYEADPLLYKALQESQAMSGSDNDMEKEKGKKSFTMMMDKCAEFLSQDDGARIASIDLGGWDTHANQGKEKGRIANALALLSDGIASFKNGMGTKWKDTAVLVVTEFGRTVRANGTGGTDHGTASASFLFGGSVNGGQIIGDWPGLSRLYEDRDLYPANDLRALLKSTLNQHLGIQPDVLSSTIFPDSGNAGYYKKLFV